MIRFMYEPELSITKKSQLDEENGIIVFLGNMKKKDVIRSLCSSQAFC
jgi:hypothetical protein